MRVILQEMKPRIVMMEEAAEVGEAHTITSLNGGCEHVSACMTTTGYCSSS